MPILGWDCRNTPKNIKSCFTKHIITQFVGGTMRATTLVIMAIFFSLTACGSSKEETAKAKKPRNLTENPLVTKGDLQVDPETLEPYSGHVFEMHEDERVMKLQVFLMDGKREGKQSLWYQNGKKQAESEFRDGKEQGMSTAWDEYGQKLVRGELRDDKKQGKLTEWNEDGSLRMVQECDKGDCKPLCDGVQDCKEKGH